MVFEIQFDKHTIKIFSCSTTKSLNMARLQMRISCNIDLSNLKFGLKTII